MPSPLEARRAPRRGIDLETLETRRLMATFAVTNAADAGAGSLRQAILDANFAVGVDSITFAIGTGPATISPLTALPKVLDAAIIDGTTQPGFAGTPLITLDGANRLFNGISLSAGNSTLRGLNITRFGLNGVETDIAPGNVIAGNTVTANLQKGIDVNTSSNRIGGSVAADRNIISGNGSIGLDLANGSVNNLVIGNYIGINAAGTAPQANTSYGLRIVNSSDNAVGGVTPGERNVIAGNNADGIRITGTSSNNVIRGNYIGTNAAGNAALPNRDNGITVFSPSNRIGGTAAGAGNVISGNRADGIRISGAANNVVEGNRVGTDPAGASAIGNGQFGTAGTAGIRVLASTNTVIGGTIAAAQNLVSGNFAEGIRIEGLGAAGTLVQGNIIGLNAAGNAPIMNDGDGIQVISGTHTIGGTTPGARNVISGNGDDGIELQTIAATGNIIQGNFLGTDVTGTVAIGNHSDGVEIQGAINSIIGGTTPTARNLLSGNTSDGVEVLLDLSGEPTGSQIQGNYIGVNINRDPLGNGGNGLNLKCGGFANYGGSPAAANVIAHNGLDGISLIDSESNDLSHNSIYSNGGLGIDIDLDGPNPNDALDADIGPNALQNYPVLLTANSDGVATMVHFTLDSAPSTTYRVDFYSIGVVDASGYGEGQSWGSRVEVTTDASGHADTTVAIPALSPGQVVSATAMDPLNNTSEFSQAVTVTVSSDTTPPGVLASSLQFDRPLPFAPHTIRLTFSEEVGASLTAADLLVQNLTLNATIPTGAMLVGYNPGTNEASVTFPGLPGGVLPDGNYTFTLAAGSVADGAGNALAQAYAFSDFVFAGDANHDRRIDIDDFGILASRFNNPGTFSQGDFNYDGVANIDDFGLLASRFNGTLPAARLVTSSGPTTTPVFSSERLIDGLV